MRQNALHEHKGDDMGGACGWHEDPHPNPLPEGEGIEEALTRTNA